ncbi:DUF2897 family protein [Alteromonas sp. A081]|uniref:DUF2897 family protein n=1 Tax=Alteromonas sp. A081 TaxID=3410269 RepID=UPI003B97F4CC
MDTIWVIVIVVLVLGVVVGNITLLKYSAKFKFPTPSKPFDDDKGSTAPTGNSKGKKTTSGFDDEDDKW